MGAHGSALLEQLLAGIPDIVQPSRKGAVAAARGVHLSMTARVTADTTHVDLVLVQAVDLVGIYSGYSGQVQHRFSRKHHSAHA